MIHCNIAVVGGKNKRLEKQDVKWKVGRLDFNRQLSDLINHCMYNFMLRVFRLRAWVGTYRLQFFYRRHGDGFQNFFSRRIRINPHALLADEAVWVNSPFGAARVHVTCVNEPPVGPMFYPQSNHVQNTAVSYEQFADNFACLKRPQRISAHLCIG
jgi:hypothetical protein